MDPCVNTNSNFEFIWQSIGDLNTLVSVPEIGLSDSEPGPVLRTLPADLTGPSDVHSRKPWVRENALDLLSPLQTLKDVVVKTCHGVGCTLPFPKAEQGPFENLSKKLQMPQNN